VDFLKIREAAVRLNVSPSTLRAWEERFGFPQPARSPGGHRLYRRSEIAALREALELGLSISSAIAHVRQGGDADADALAGPLAALDGERAARVLEAALVLLPLERAVEEVLLRALQIVDRRHGPDSVEWAFAAAWVDEWLRWARRLAHRPERPVGILLGDVTRDVLDAESLDVRALQLFLVRAGVHVLALPVRAMKGLTEAVVRLRPQAIVLAGDRGAPVEVARWTAVARSAAGPHRLALYRAGRHAREAPDAHLLDPAPLAAHRQLLLLADGR
jgi:MerR family transcriptional regulator, light-induced transcriptional regulator